MPPLKAQRAQQTEPRLPEGVREGSRWLHRRPTGEEVADWFSKNVKLAEGMEHERYVGGITLIGGSERLKEPRIASDGSTHTVDVERYGWTPYTKIETRIAYWCDLMARDDEVVGAIEPVEHARLGEQGVYNLNLPPGFFRMPIMTAPDHFVHFIGATMRALAYKADTLEWHDKVRKVFNEAGVQVDEYTESILRGIPVAVNPPASKQIAAVSASDEADPYSVMKAETGAIGRALGMAGILVLPGSGIATAEDMQEIATAAGKAVRGEASLPAATPGEAPDVAALEASTRERISAGIADLQSTDQDAYERLETWSRERKIDLTEPRDTQLRGLELQLERIKKRG